MNMISIVIPIYNKHEMSTECINTIRECTQGDYELIIIDNGSEPPFKPPFTGHNETTLIRNLSNLGFPVAVNQGIRAAAGDVIVLLNNDVFVTPGWLDKLTSWLDEFSIVAPVTNYCAGLQRVTIGSYENLNELNEEAGAWAEGNDGYAEEVNFVIGFCMAFKKSLIDEIGYFDESLWPCSGEEIDFCLRAREAGHKIGIAVDVYVHHEGSQTFNEMQKAGQLDYMAICVRNDKHLAKRWGADFWERQAIEITAHEDAL
jgi:GT2 family glycosyltransferase